MSQNFFKVRDGFAFTPGVAPASPENGIVYYDQAADVLYFYQNGAFVAGNSSGSASQFVSLDSNAKQFAVVDSGLKTFNYSDLLSSLALDVWSATGSLNTGRHYNVVAGTQNNAITFGGQNGGVRLTSAEFYSGSSWTTSAASMGTGRGGLASAGTRSATLAIGGLNPSNTVLSSAEKFNGSSWSSTGSMSTTRTYLGSAGIQNNALAIGGYNGSIFATCEAFNGATFSSTGSMNTAVYGNLTCIGTGSAALRAGGYTGANTSTVEKFNSSAWVSTANLPAATDSPGGAGTQNSAILAGGVTGAVTNASEKFNGNNWQYTSPMLSITFGGLGGSANAAVRAGVYSELNPCEKFIGQLPYKVRLTFKGNTNEQYETDYGQLVIQNDTGTLLMEVIPQYLGSPNTQENIDLVALDKIDLGDGVWSATGSLPLAKEVVASAGFQNAMLGFGGLTSVGLTATDRFDGLAWSTIANLNTGRYGALGTGVQNAALTAGGNTNPTDLSSSEKFNGISWTATGSLAGTARHAVAGAGVMNASIIFGGMVSSTAQTTAERFSGSTWSLIGPMGTSMGRLAGCGTQNAALAIGGTTPGTNSAQTTVQQYNGSAWSNAPSKNVALYWLAGCGTLNNALQPGGNPSAGASDNCEKFNGAVWAFTANLVVATQTDTATGNARGATISGGSAPTLTANSYKFNTQVPNPFVSGKYGTLTYTLAATQVGV